MNTRYLSLAFLFVFLALPLHLNAAEASLVESESSMGEAVESSTNKLKRMKELADRGELQASFDEPQSSREELSYGKAIQGLFLCLGVFFISVYFLKKSSKAISGIDARRVQMLERLSVGGKNSLLLVQVDGKDLLLGMSENGVSLLKSLDENVQRKVISVNSEVGVKAVEENKLEQFQCANE